MPPSLPTDLETLYATPDYQVRLRRILPGASLSSECPANMRQDQGSASPEHITPIRQYDRFLIKGALHREPEGQNPGKSSVAGTSAEPIALIQPGQRLDGLKPESAGLRNASDEVALCLEIIRGEGIAPVPLGDVTEQRPWGSFTILKDEPEYKLKQLMVTPGSRLSLQRHQKREEHWIVTRGYPEVTVDDRRVHLAPGDYIRIPLHSWHRIANPTVASTPDTPAAHSGEVDNPAAISGQQAPNTASVVEIIELQLGTYFGEDDIERRQDDYGRA